MNDQIRETVQRLKTGLAELYGERLKGVYLPEQRWRNEDTMFLINVREEAVPA